MKRLLALQLSIFFFQGLVFSQTIKIEFQVQLFMTEERIKGFEKVSSPLKTLKQIDQFDNTSWMFELAIANDSAWLYKYVSLSPAVNQFEPRMYSTLQNYGTKDGYTFRTPSVDSLDYYAEIQELTVDDWVIDESWEGEQLGYALKRAVLKSNPQISADFTEQIPISAGPGGWHGLPGVIFHLLDKKNGREYTAISVEELPSDYEIDFPAGEKIKDKYFVKLLTKDRWLMRL